MPNVYTPINICKTTNPKIPGTSNTWQKWPDGRGRHLTKRDLDKNLIIAAWGDFQNKHTCINSGGPFESLRPSETSVSIYNLKTSRNKTTDPNIAHEGNAPRIKLVRNKTHRTSWRTTL